MKTYPASLKLLIVSCTLLFVFGACKKAKYYQLAPEDLAWIIYKEGDQLKFRNPAGNLMTYDAYRKTRSYTVSGSNYYEESGISIKLVNDTVLGSAGLLYIVKKEEGNIISIAWPHFYGKLFLSSAVAFTDTIGGHIYTDLYSATSADITGTNNIKSFYYSKLAGMVQFTTRDTVTWTKAN
ncbi:MAG TPA: hypothetical protein VJY62_18030 [Bacteroidia bacterium]|nr:hypothetical protein [Bacteroidia bacterium]